MTRTSALCAALTLSAALLAGAPAGAPAVAPPGQPEGTTSALTPSFSPNRLGAPAALTLKIDYTGAPHRVPAPATHTLLHLPAGLIFDLSSVSACPRAQALHARCPASSRVGVGSTVAIAHLGSQTLTENATVNAYRGANQGGHPTMLISSQGITPLIERVLITGVLQRDRPPYGVELALSIPPIPTLPTEPNASIFHFTLTIGGAHGPRALVRVPRSCPASGFPFGADFTFADGSTGSTTTTARCP
ncbi:MAG: hypothetical protein ACHQDY_10070 [Solirubrobacterales bacterium]